jgi:hypothetical protein
MVSTRRWLERGVIGRVPDWLVRYQYSIDVRWYPLCYREDLRSRYYRPPE